MEQLELFPNQDYEDALAWLTEGAKAYGYSPEVIAWAREDFNWLRHEGLSRATLFERAVYYLYEGYHS